MSRRNVIGVLFFLLGGGLLYFFITGTPTPKFTGFWIIAAIFLGMAVCGLCMAFEKEKPNL